MSIRIVIGGVANCGKSTLTASIYTEVRARGISVGIHELDVFENTIPYILGIESWEQRIKVKSGDWSNPRINWAIDDFIKDESRFVLGDLTGIIDSLLEKMVKNADSAIVIGKDQQSLQKWLRFFDSQNIPVIIKIISCINGDILPQIFSPDIIFVKNLKRKVLQNDEIRKVVNILLSHYSYTG